MIQDQTRRRIFCWGRLGTVGYFCFLTFMLLYPRPQQIISTPSISILHCLVFAVLGFGVEFFWRRSPSLSLGWIMLLWIYSAGTEVMQIYTGRYFEWVDIFQNIVGVCFGVVVANLLKRIVCRKTPSSKTTLSQKSVN